MAVRVFGYSYAFMGIRPLGEKRYYGPYFPELRYWDDWCKRTKRKEHANKRTKKGMRIKRGKQ